MYTKHLLAFNKNHIDLLIYLYVSFDLDSVKVFLYVSNFLCKYLDSVT